MPAKSCLKTALTIVVLFLLTNTSATVHAKIIYVDDDAAGANDGSSWTDAFIFLQDALAAAYSGDKIHVAQGIYKPDQRAGITPGDRTATFQLINGVTIKGGYAGAVSPDPDAHDVELYETILIGDLDGDDIAIVNPEELANEPTRTDNSYHVIKAVGIDATAVLDGFTITGGAAYGQAYEDKCGGGMYNYNSSPTILNCTFTENSAAESGGGIYMYYGNHQSTGANYIFDYNRELADLMNNTNSDNTIKKCTFTKNLAVNGGAIYCRDYFGSSLIVCVFENNTADVYGGAISNTGGGELSIIHCEFRDGTAKRGGAVYNGYASLVLSRCTLVGNQADYAGAIDTDGDITLTSCLLVNNRALVWGGALANMTNTSRTINCTLVSNSATTGGAIYSNIECDTTIINSILRYNNAQTGSHVATSGDHVGSTLTVDYCNIEDYMDGFYVPSGCTLIWGENNGGGNPRFVDRNNGDYRLHYSSHLIDFGDTSVVEPNSKDLDGNPRVVNNKVDLGAYENQTPWARTIYVDDDATGANDGLSWENAFTDLQDALELAKYGDEIHVSRGTYTPAPPGGDRSASFQLKNGVKLMGGYVDVTYHYLGIRNPKVYKTILSGDLNGDDDTVGMNDNSFCVVYAEDHIDPNTVLDGLIISGGYAVKDYSSGHGAGLLTYAASPTVVNCTFTGNYTLGYSSGGAGIYTYNGSPVISDCTFRDNHAEGYAARGAGFCNYEGAPVVTDCTFIGNTTVGDSSGGAGMRTYSGSAVISNCTFRDNHVQGRDADGAGLWNYRGPIVVTDCRFIENTAVGDQSDGAGLYNYEGNITVTGCSFIDNFASGPSSSAAGMKDYCGDSTITSCTFKGNHGPRHGGGLSTYDGSPTVKYCTFTGNSAEYGAGFWSYGGNSIVSHCTFSDNNSMRDGGAICNFIGSPTVSNCLFAANSSEDGAAFWTSYGVPNIINCTFTSNKAAQRGGGIWSYKATLNIVNSILWKNIDETGDAEQAQIFTQSGQTSISHSWIARDPIFFDPENSDYHLKADSPCIDAGDSSIVAPEEVDLDGKMRIRKSAVDIGAYEGAVDMYVDDDATGANDGTSWRDAFDDLQAALALAFPDDVIHVAQGVYKPAAIAGDRSVSFNLKGGLKIIGGYAGITGDDPNDCDADKYKTILSGDLNGNDGRQAGEMGFPGDHPKNDNSYHVLRIEEDQRATSLKGLIITAGVSNGHHEDIWGGGLLGIEANLIINDCLFEDNIAMCGGAVCLLDSTTVFNNCRFIDNYGTDGGALSSYGPTKLVSCEFVGNWVNGHGGAIDSGVLGMEIIGCTFTDNKAFLSYASGGAVYLSGDNEGGRGGFISNSVFNNNWSEHNGGAVYLEQCDPPVIDCTFTNNSTGYIGGAMHCWDSGEPVLIGCTFTSNTAGKYGGAVTNCPEIIQCKFIENHAERGGAFYNMNAPTALTGCIFLRNSAEYAGAINTYGDITLINCLLAENSASVWGGALANMENNPTSINCTYVNNSAQYGGAIFSNIECHTTVINSILWNNSAQTGSQISTSCSHGGSSLTVEYCDITDGKDGLYVPGDCPLNWGPGNIDAEPGFADSNNGDYRLSVGSPCVDTADNNSIPPDSYDLDADGDTNEPTPFDLDGNARIDDGDDDGDLVVDMGAYELPLPPLQVNMKFVPKSLNLGSKGKWIKAHFVLPEPLTVEDVDESRPAEIENLELTSKYMEVFVNEDGLVVVRAVFERSHFCDVGPFEGEVAVVGFLKTGRKFRGTDTIRIMTNNLKHLGLVASHWLADDCAHPGWCSDADLDKDSVVNFVDFAMLGNCCFEVIKD